MNNFQPKTLFIGKNSIYLPSCHSTNDFASQIIQKQTVFDGTVVITDHQTAGRGQRGNTWEAKPNENITVSVILKPNFLQANEQFRLNIAVSLGIHEFLSNYIAHDLKIKWSNDIYVGNKKLGGVLIENSLAGSRISHSIIGIGLNINQLAFEESKATSLKIISPRQDFNLQKLIEELCFFLEKQYFNLKNGNHLLQKKEYLSHLFRFNETHFYIKNNQKFLGKIVDVAENGMLMIQIENEILSFDFKEISFVF